MTPLGQNTGSSNALLHSSAARAWAEELLALPLDEGVERLIRTPMLQDWVERFEGFEARYLAKTAEIATRGFAENDEAAKAEAHGALFALYELPLCRPDDEAARNQHDPLLCRIRHRLESTWLAAEHRTLSPEAPGDAAQTVAAIARFCKTHRASSHPLFDYLAVEAGHAEMQRFFASDSALNIRFFDLLVLSMVGSEEFTRPELVQNLWDESGRGNKKEAHVRTFRDLLDTCGLTQARSKQVDALSWQGRAGHNLFMMTALSRAHYWKLLGVMAVTELIDPSSYEKVVRGCARLGIASEAYRYYSEHVEIDVVHGAGWLNNVIVPLIERTPAAAVDVVFGAQLRLASCEQYYDYLLSLLERETRSMAPA